MADPRLVNHESSIREFKEVVKACEMKGICGRTFIRVEKLKAWVSGQIERLLEAAYHTTSQSQPTLPISERHMHSKDNDKSILLIFCILLEMGWGRLIHCFHSLGYSDWYLGGIDSGSLRLHLQRKLDREGLVSALELDVETFAKEFARRQWRFCPVKFELDDRKDRKPQQIIPIHKRLVVNNKGFTASVWQVEVLEEFIGQSMKEAIPTSKYQDENDGLGQRYILALKTFDEGKRSFFENEIKAFLALDRHPGLIRYLGDYSHRDYLSDRDTYNILLEFGERDLDEFFFDPSHLPPVLPNEIRKFWADIFEIAPAVRDIHSFRRRRGGESREYFGWHADIKPDNILRVKERFKLADPGFACFELGEGNARLGNREQTTNIGGGTITFGAPECHPGRKNRSSVTRSIDIWSLGCVFSISATWVVLGAQGILQFTQLREQAIKKKIEQDTKAQPQNALVTLQPGDYFHDGDGVLDVVLNWHKHLRNAQRRTDTITSTVLDLVDKHMIRKTAEDRISAKELHTKLKDILSESQQQPTEVLPESLQQALVQIDISAPSAPTKMIVSPDPKSVTPGDDASQDRKTRKSRLLDLPLMKTAHRSEVLPALPEENTHPAPPLPNRVAPALQAPWQPPTGSRSVIDEKPPAGSAGKQRHREDQLENTGRPTTINRTSTGLTYTISPPEMPSSPEPQKQNMWQVHEKIKPLKSKLSGKYPKDPQMSAYFGDRDIQFLIDNADSMTEHWAEACYLLEALAMKASGQDEDGMDLCFTNGNVHAEGKKRPGTLLEKMQDPNARADPKHGWQTDITTKLESLFLNYLSYVSKSRRKVRYLVIIIFTDGKWEGMKNKHEIENSIVRFVGKLKDAQNGYLHYRQVSFQFIQFGDDEDARHRLQRLDDDLPFRDIPDLVDTEDSRGDVNKMLVGSFDPKYDAKNKFALVRSNSSSHQSGYSRDSALIEDQQSTSPSQMETYTSQGAAHHQRVDSGHAREPVPSFVINEHSRKN